MQISVSMNFDLSVDAVVNLLANQQFLQFKADQSDTVLLAADIIKNEDGALTSAVRRTMSSDLIPQNLRSFVGNQLEVRQTEAWAEKSLSPGTRYGTFALEITGAPVRVSGNMTVMASGTGSVLTYTGDVVSAVPLFATTVETAVGQAITKVFEHEEEYARQWLAQNE